MPRGLQHVLAAAAAGGGGCERVRSCERMREGFVVLRRQEAKDVLDIQCVLCCQRKLIHFWQG